MNATDPHQPGDADLPKDASDAANPPPRPGGVERSATVPLAAEPPAVELPAVVLDCRGQRCPLPVIALAKRLPALPVGATLTVLADDPAAAVDIPAWCRMRAQRFVAATVVDDTPAYTVQRLT